MTSNQNNTPEEAKLSLQELEQKKFSLMLDGYTEEQAEKIIVDDLNRQNKKKNKELPDK